MLLLLGYKGTQQSRETLFGIAKRLGVPVSVSFAIEDSEIINKATAIIPFGQAALGAIPSSFTGPVLQHVPSPSTLVTLTSVQKRVEWERIMAFVSEHSPSMGKTIVYTAEKGTEITVGEDSDLTWQELQAISTLVESLGLGPGSVRLEKNSHD